MGSKAEQAAAAAAEELSALLEGLNSEDRARFQEEYKGMMSAMQAEAFQNMDDEHMKAYVDVVLSKWTNPSFWEATLVEPMALEVIRERLSPEHSEILGKVGQMWDSLRF
jgi:hypothetical protein